MEARKALMSSQISSTRHSRIVDILNKHCPTAGSTEHRAITSDKPVVVSSDSAKEAKRVRRRLERRWKAKGNKNDYVAYRRACRAANKEIINARCNFYKKQIAEAAEKSTHDDDRPSAAYFVWQRARLSRVLRSVRI